MDEEQRLYSIMAVAEDQQKSVWAAIDAMKEERGAFTRERVALEQAADRMVVVAGEVAKAASNGIPGIRKALVEVVDDATKKSFTGASDVASKALKDAVGPVMESFSRASQTANSTSETLKQAGAWFAWKWVAVAAGGLFGVCAVAYLALAWQFHQVNVLQGEKDALSADIQEMQSKVSALVKIGGNARLTKCGPTNRLCFEIATDRENTWFGQDGKTQYMVIKGY